jgi:hypothetical protein
MEGNIDLIDLLHALNAEGAKYLLVGGYALAFHGKIRATKDVDVFVGTDSENAARVWSALRSFGAPLDELRTEDLMQPNTFFIMGRAPNQIDIITTIDGVEFDEAWQHRVASSYGPESVFYISREDLIRNKAAAGRPQDLVDVAYLTGKE